MTPDPMYKLYCEYAVRINEQSATITMEKFTDECRITVGFDESPMFEKITFSSVVMYNSINMLRDYLLLDSHCISTLRGWYYERERADNANI